VALTSFGVTNADVLERVPLDTSQVDASSEPINTGDIDEFIQDASSAFVAILQRAGLDPASLNDDTQRQVQGAVEAYAVAEVLDVIGIGDVERYRQKYERLREMYASKPSMLSTVNGGRLRWEAGRERLFPSVISPRHPEHVWRVKDGSFEFGTSVPYAANHQYGRGRGPAWAGFPKIKKRKFLALTRRTAANITVIIRRYMGLG